MKAGPYIRGQVDSELELATYLERTAAELQAKAAKHREQAREALKRARSWAEGTDIQLPVPTVSGECVPARDPRCITWHSSAEDSGPDVGLSVRIGPDDDLYAGEISDALFERHKGAARFGSSAGWFLVRFGKETEIIARFGDEPDDRTVAQEFIEWIAGR